MASAPYNPDLPPPPHYSPYGGADATGEPGYPHQPHYPPPQQPYPPNPQQQPYPPNPQQQPYPPNPQQQPYPPNPQQQPPQKQPPPYYPQQPYPHPYPGQAGYPQVPQVHVVNPVLSTYAHFGEAPTGTVCPGCGASITTHTDYKAGALTWILCFVIFIFGFILGCCLIPFCINSFKDVVHTCPNCNRMVGKYNRI